MKAAGQTAPPIIKAPVRRDQFSTATESSMVLRWTIRYIRGKPRLRESDSGGNDASRLDGGHTQTQQSISLSNGG